MDIKNYTSFFHDGTILDIIHAENNVVITMESADMGKEDLKDDATLTDNKRIRGNLVITALRSAINEEGSSNLSKGVKINSDLPFTISNRTAGLFGNRSMTAR